MVNYKKPSNAEQVIKSYGYDIENNNLDDLLRYDAWYKGYDSNFHDYSFFFNGKKQQCRRKQLFLGKKVCEEHASLLNFDKTTITVENQVASAFLTALFEKRDFYYKMMMFMEWVVAYGYGLSLNLLDDSGKTQFILLNPLQFYTIQRDVFGTVTGIAVPFEQFLYIETYEKGTITTRFILADEDGQYDVDNPENKIKEIKRDEPLFTIFESALATSNFDKPYAQSILHGATDYLKMIDLVVTSLSDEFTLGRKRIVISDSALTEKIDLDSGDNESLVRYFDPNDTVFQYLPNTTFGETELIKEINMQLRVSDHKSAINTLLNLLSHQVSLGSNYFSFTQEGDNLTTATQVLSNKSETYRNLKKFETNLEVKLKQMIRSLLFVSGVDDKTDISIKFDDSILQDDTVERQTAIQEVQSNILSRRWYLINVKNLSEKEADEIIEEIRKEEILEITRSEKMANTLGSGLSLPVDNKELGNMVVSEPTKTEMK